MRSKRFLRGKSCEMRPTGEPWGLAAFAPFRPQLGYNKSWPQTYTDLSQLWGPKASVVLLRGHGTIYVVKTKVCRVLIRFTANSNVLAAEEEGLGSGKNSRRSRGEGRRGEEREREREERET